MIGRRRRRRRASTTPGCDAATTASARRSWAATCSGRCAASGRLLLARLVGRGAAVPPPGVRADALRAAAAGDDGYDVPLRHRRARVGARTGDRGRGRSRRADRRGCVDRWRGAARGLVDEIHLAVVPVLMRGGERLYEDLGSWPEGYSCVEREPDEGALHVRFERTAVANRPTARTGHGGRSRVLSNHVRRHRHVLRPDEPARRADPRRGARHRRAGGLGARARARRGLNHHDLWTLKGVGLRRTGCR